MKAINLHKCSQLSFRIYQRKYFNLLKMNNSQVINTTLIVIGGACLLYAISVDDASPYFEIIGLVIIMLGLYRATNYWVATKDDHEGDSEKKDQ